MTGVKGIALDQCRDYPFPLFGAQFVHASRFQNFKLYHYRNLACFFPKQNNVQLNMSQRENGHLPLPRQPVRSRISAERWEQIKTAYASGVGLREIARNMGIAAGTILSRAKREGWSKQVDDAKALAKRDDTSTAVTPFEAVSASMQQRGERHIGRVAGLTERMLMTFEQLSEGEQLRFVDELEKLTRSEGALSGWMKPGAAAAT